MDEGKPEEEVLGRQKKLQAGVGGTRGDTQGPLALGVAEGGAWAAGAVLAPVPPPPKLTLIPSNEPGRPTAPRDQHAVYRGGEGGGSTSSCPIMAACPPLMCPIPGTAVSLGSCLHRYLSALG